MGSGSDSWPVPEGSMPANLEIVMLSTSGSGTVVKDNSQEIGTKLFEAAGTTGSDVAMLKPPQNGVIIGGTQTVTPHGPTSPNAADGSSNGNGCSVSHVRTGTRTGSALALWLPLGGVILALRRRRPTALASQGQKS
jgi:hypothetical protein